jgi:pimeloyl-ACP methyl ester carboxylesterase
MRSSLILTVALLSSGCVKRYSAMPTLAFADVEYAGPSGSPAWPLKSVQLPGAKARYNLGHAPTLRYVELNPEGKQTVVFLHGLGSYLKFWRAQLDETAARGYHVVAIDQLGFGKSEKPAGFPYTTESFGENVVELLDLLHVDHAILVGHSMGGQTALSTAIRFPSRVQALVLVSPAGFEVFSPREQKWFKNVYARALVLGQDEEGIWGNIREGNFQKWQPDYEWLIEERVREAKPAADGIAAAESAAADARKQPGADLKAIAAQEKAGKTLAVAQAKEFDAYAYAQVRTVEGLAQNNFVRESLAAIVAPTIIVYGNGDRLIPNAFLHGGFTRTIMEAGQAGIAGSELKELDGCGHTLQLDCSKDFNETLFGFLSKVSALPPMSVEPSSTPVVPDPAP